MDQSLGMDPTQSVPVDRELAGIIGQDDRIGQEAVRPDAAPHRSFGGEAHRIGRDPQRGDPEPLEMPHPGALVLEVPLGVRGQLGDHRASQGVLAHVGQGLGADQVIAVASPQHLQEVQPAFRSGGGKPGEVVVTELGADAVLVLVAGAGIVDADPRCARQPGPQHIARLFKKGVLACIQQPHDLPLGDRDADGPKLGHQAGHRDLSLVVLEQNEPAQLRPEVTDNAPRHRRHHRPAVRSQPAFAAEHADAARDPG
jgi:hypothetical protein